MSEWVPGELKFTYSLIEGRERVEEGKELIDEVSVLQKFETIHVQQKQPLKLRQHYRTDLD